MRIGQAHKPRGHFSRAKHTDALTINKSMLRRCHLSNLRHIVAARDLDRFRCYSKGLISPNGIMVMQNINPKKTLVHSHRVYLGSHAPKRADLD